MVDHGHDRLDPLEILGVLGHVGPGRHQLRDEGDPLAELRMLLQEDVEAAESAQHVLRQIRTIDAQDQMIAPAVQQLLLELVDAVPLGHPLHGVGVDRERIGPDPDLAVLAVHHAAFVIDLVAHQVLAALQEIPAIAPRVKADDVVGQDSPVDLLADHRGQHAPGVRLAPRDMHEVVEEHIRADAPDQSRQGVQVIVVHHHDGPLESLDLVHHRPREVLVDRVVTELERLGLVAPDVRRIREIPQVMLDEPQHRVRGDVVEAVVRVGV